MEQIVDISQDGRHLSRDRGFMQVEAAGETIGRVPLDQITAVIAHSHGITWSNSLLVELANRGAPVVLCGANHQPRAVICSLDGHHMQNARMRAQWDAPQPLIKQAWKQIVIAKIKMQAAALAAIGQPPAPLDMLARNVQSGDSGNTEAQAARIYWPLIMGRDFRRDKDLPDINALLNYGYTVLRAATARAVVAAGLHPTIGLFHSNRSNAFALADDLIEPFRPLVDLTARAIATTDGPEVTSQAKRRMAELIALDLPLTGETSPVSVALSRLATSLAQSFETRKLRLALPEAPPPLVLSGLGK
ncbi:MAG: type II CRISPR-associated endonuclease Cas1 [Paracoccus sp. (in: a-proteobacteria)]|uniref:type II CRISPR-associated endonuclease Cas1 n=1 Tax=Paracoccus sp. TaxID=267 RepID=UPI0026DECD19|nr:type II CRISPR-associated endonuclease Cas1 [Paracoccus sp. (in: a-proteobacteria)]MDO5612902.1 type II CRISPR-associated endonuclease Cas1 [Paracoccus sp. (in: a-proteobacteria)]